MNLQTNKPSLAGKSSLQNTYVTQCKICGAGVYEKQAWHWSVRPIGIVHTDCVVTK